MTDENAHSTGVVSWYAVKVAPRAEFRVQTAFSRLERPSLLPTGERSVARENRPNLKRWRRYPLIPGYVFGGFFSLVDFVLARQSINAPLEAMGQPRDVAGLVGFGNKPAVLRPTDIIMLSTMTEEPPVETVPFTTGQTVNVYGQKTKIEKVHEKRREFDAFVEMLGGMRLITVGFDTVRAA